MSIKYISFDLDDTFWDVMPTIYRAEDKTKEWIKDNFPGVTKVMDTDTVVDLRNKILKEDPSLLVKISELRTRIFYETAIMAGYSEMESHEMSQKAFQIFINARNDVKLFDGVRETLESLCNKYSLGVSSTVLTFVRKKKILINNFKSLEEITKLAFNKRRNSIKNSLKNILRIILCTFFFHSH